MATGYNMLQLAATRVGERYVYGALSPKDNPGWHGPWDCAEFISWVVYQAIRQLYGCDKNNTNPATANAYTGFWQNEAGRRCFKIDVSLAAKTAGALVVRYPLYNPRTDGHIALSDGRGGTIEAKSAREGVVFDQVAGRRWDIGLLLPGVDYSVQSAAVPATRPNLVFKLTNPLMRGNTVAAIQRSLAAKGFNPGRIDGMYGRDTVAAVVAFQRFDGLVADGEVGSQTAGALGVRLEG